MFDKATTDQLKTIWYHEKDLCSPKIYKQTAMELLKRGEFHLTLFQKATNQQLWLILNDDQYVQTEHLIGIVRELFRRNEFNQYIEKSILKIFNTIAYAEESTSFSKQDLTFLGYRYAVDSIFEYKQGKGTFLDYYFFILSNNFKALAYYRKRNIEKFKAIV